MLFMAYQMTFAVITCALVGGAVADRMKFSAFALFCALWLLLVYVPSAHWVWGGGFLARLGLIDFAGGTVVHVNAGVAGLTAALIVGARQGYGRENLAPSDLSLAVIGAGMLWVGWFGFNGGSALGVGSRAVFAIVATHLSACAGATVWSGLEWVKRGKPSVLGLISGAVAGLGAITPASGYVLPWHGALIGALAGAVCYFASTTLKTRIGYDDSLDVFGVHGVGGALGTLLAGVFATAAVSASATSPGVAGLLEGQRRSARSAGDRRRRHDRLVRRRHLDRVADRRRRRRPAGQSRAGARRSRRGAAWRGDGALGRRPGERPRRPQRPDRDPVPVARDWARRSGSRRARSRRRGQEAADQGGDHRPAPRASRRRRP